MRQIDKAEAQGFLNDHKKGGHKVDSRLLEEIEKGQLYRFQIEDQATFLSLIWIEHDAARLLTPKDQPRTLRDVAERLIRANYTFAALTGPAPNQHDPKWFEPCVPIDAAFDFNKFGWVAVEPANDDERKQSPCGSFYVFDGLRRTLVLAKRLLKRETAFKAIDTLYLVPRRD